MTEWDRETSDNHTGEIEVTLGNITYRVPETFALMSHHLILLNDSLDRQNELFEQLIETLKEEL